MHFDDILSNIARDVSSRAPPTPRQVLHALPYEACGWGVKVRQDIRQSDHAAQFLV